MDAKFVVALIVCLVVVVLIRILAKQKNPLGRIARGFWNISFKFVSFIPFFGWMSHFIIADTEQEKAAKEKYQEVGRKVDNAAYDNMEKRARRQQEEQERERIKLEERQRMEREITSRLKDKSLPVHVHENTVDIGDQTYTMDEIKNKFRLK